MKQYNVCVKNGLRVYKFRIVAISLAKAMQQLQQYIDLTGRHYKLKYIMEA